MAHGGSRRIDWTRLEGMDSGVEAKDVIARGRVLLRRCGERQHLAMTVDHDGGRGLPGGIQRASEVLELVDRATVDGANHVTRLQPGIARRRTGVHGADLDRRLDLGRTDRGVDAEEDQDRQRQVERGPGDDDHEALPEGMRVEAARPGVHAAVHPGQLDEATKRDGPDGIERLAARPSEELGAEAHAEMLPLDAGELAGDQVTRLVHDHEEAEDEDDERDEHHRAHAGSWLQRRVGPLPAARSWAGAHPAPGIPATSVSCSPGSGASSARATEGTMSTKPPWPWRKSATAS